MPQIASKLRLLKSRPLRIICAKPQEARTIAETLDITGDLISGHDIPEIDNGHNFYLGTFTWGSGDRQRKLEYYVTSSLWQGIQAFATSVGILFHVLRPQFAVHAGVCAGYAAKNIRLTDVIFGDSAINYEEGKWVVEKGVKVFRPEFRMIEGKAGEISSFAQNRREPKYKYGIYISGSAVRQDAEEIFSQLGENVNRNICALDMEASAFLMLCNFLHVGCLGVVKGVSDFGDAHKGEEEDVYEEALKETALAVQKWAIQHLRTVQWRVSEDSEAGAHIVKGYYDNFVRVILDSVGADQDIAINKIPGKRISADMVKGMKVIMPDKDDPNNFAEHGQKARMVRESNMLDVTVGRGNMSRTLYYKAGYLIDFPRNINSLTEEAEPVYQTQVFQRTLKKEKYFRSGDPPEAAVISWQEFEQFRKDNPGPEVFEEEPLLL